MLRRVALVRTDVSEELSASFIRMTRIGELGTTLEILVLCISSQCASVANVVPNSTGSCHPDDGGSKRRLLKEPHGVTSQKTAFFKLSEDRIVWFPLILQGPNGKQLKGYTYGPLPSNGRGHRKAI
jgi:hypothetical protein